jgi:hypothetical protein
MPFLVRAVAARKVRAAPEQESEQIEKKEPHRAVPSQVIRNKQPTKKIPAVRKMFLFLRKRPGKTLTYVLLAWQKHDFLCFSKT